MSSDETDGKTQYETQAGYEDGLHRQSGMVPVSDEWVSLL
jgi:hypothetical protein